METRLKEKIARLTDAQRQVVSNYIDTLLKKEKTKNLIKEPEATYQVSNKKKSPVESPQDNNELNVPVTGEEEKSKRLKREFGSLKDVITYIADDFDAPLKDFKDYM